MTDRIGLTDDQKAILDQKLQRAVQARQEAERAAREFNEAIELVGGPGAEYRQDEGVVVPATPSDGVIQAPTPEPEEEA